MSKKPKVILTQVTALTQCLVVAQFQSYVEPPRAAAPQDAAENGAADASAAPAAASAAGEEDAAALAQPLEEGTLIHNLGVPVIVVCTKVRMLYVWFGFCVIDSPHPHSHAIVCAVLLSHQCDASGSLERERDFRQEHFDFIQMHLR